MRSHVRLCIELGEREDVNTDEILLDSWTIQSSPGQPTLLVGHFVPPLGTPPVTSCGRRSVDNLDKTPSALKEPCFRTLTADRQRTIVCLGLANAYS